MRERTHRKHQKVSQTSLKISEEFVKEFIDFKLEERAEHKPTYQLVKNLFGGADREGGQYSSSFVGDLTESICTFTEKLTKISGSVNEHLDRIINGGPTEFELTLMKRSIIGLFFDSFTATNPSGSPEEILRQAKIYAESPDLGTQLTRYWVRYTAFVFQPEILASEREIALVRACQKLRRQLRNASDEIIDQVAGALSRLESEKNKVSYVKRPDINDVSELLTKGFSIDTRLFFAEIFNKHRGNLDLTVQRVQGEVTNELKKFLRFRQKGKEVKTVATLFASKLADQGVPADQAIRLTDEVVRGGEKSRNLAN